MTIQVPDHFFWNGEEQEIALSWGEGYLKALEYGVTGDTACKRGCVATYEIINNQLYVSTPEIEQFRTRQLIPFFGEIWLAKNPIIYSERVIDYQNLFN